MPKSVEKSINWFCFATVFVLAALSTYGVIEAIAAGQIEKFVKGSRELVQFATNPYGFVVYALMHLLLAGGFWFGATWLWFNRIKRSDQ